MRQVASDLITMLTDAEKTLLQKRADIPIFLKNEHDLKDASCPWIGWIGLAVQLWRSSCFFRCLVIEHSSRVAFLFAIFTVLATSLFALQILRDRYRASREQPPANRKQYRLLQVIFRAVGLFLLSVGFVALVLARFGDLPAAVNLVMIVGAALLSAASFHAYSVRNFEVASIRQLNCQIENIKAQGEELPFWMNQSPVLCFPVRPKEP
jgi:uncharacterized membrane protein YecN with MAPEG domain